MDIIADRIIKEIPLDNGDKLMVARCHPDSFRFEIYADYELEKWMLRYKILNESTKKALTHVEMWKHFELAGVYDDVDIRVIGKIWPRSGKHITAYYPILNKHGIDTNGVNNLFLLRKFKT